MQQGNRHTLKWLAVVTAAGMFLVLIMGAFVTKTGSGEGCGDDWPLCNGRFVPAFAFESIVEYSHRAVSGIEGLLVLATFIWVMAARRLRGRLDIKFYASTALFFTILQAILGAIAVVAGSSPVVMAMHFGFSLIAFASTLLLAIAIWKVYAGTSAEAGQAPVAAAPTKGFLFFVWLVTAYSYIVVYLGAFVRHTESSGGCMGWPLCNGQVIPELSGPTGIAFFHRLGALLLLIVMVWMVYVALRDYRGDVSIRHSAHWSFVLIVLQILTGGLVVTSMGTDWYVFASLVHTVIIAGLFGILCYLSIYVYQLRRRNAH